LEASLSQLNTELAKQCRVLCVRHCSYPESSERWEKRTVRNTQAIPKPTVPPDKLINKIREILLHILIHGSYIHGSAPKKGLLTLPGMFF